jgi:hypothetical protein
MCAIGNVLTVWRKFNFLDPSFELCIRAILLGGIVVIGLSSILVQKIQSIVIIVDNSF